MDLALCHISGTWIFEMAPACDYELNHLMWCLKIAYESCMFIKLFYL